MREPKIVAITDVMAILANSRDGSVSRFSSLLDARSPSEFTEDHLPGSVNSPVLNDYERIQVGTHYKEVSSFEAKKLGAAMVARNIAELLENQFKDKPKDWAPLIYCWRGGNRSGALATIMARIGWPVSLLEGGYREYRRAVLKDFETLPQQFNYRVIAGPTGSGKSQILQQLAIKGEQVLDLEMLAKHKGSVLGSLPGEPQPSQKYFDSLVWQALKSFDPSRPVFIESESKKVGSCQVPDQLIVAMRQSPCIVINASVATRVQLLINEYTHFTQDQSLLFTQLDCLIDLHGSAVIEDWKSLACALRWPEFVEATLTQHYDPAYYKSMKRNYARLPNATQVHLPAADPQSVESAAAQISATC
jgi:tRNA 2-selenouridine synthase